MARLDPRRVLGSLLARHHLAEDTRSRAVVRVADDVAGLHATSPIGPYLSLHARVRRFGRADLETELYERRRLAKVRCMRTTMFVLPVPMLAEAFAATSDLSTRASERFLAARGVDPGEAARLEARILDLLAERPMSAAEVRADLRTDLDVPAVINLMCDRGLLVRARPAHGWRSQAHIYARMDRWLPSVDLHALGARKATARLVERYVRAYGPAAVEDAAWWTGLGVLAIRRAIEDLGSRLVTAEVRGEDGAQYLSPADMETIPTAHRAAGVALLPALDPYAMGWRRRARYLDPSVRHLAFDPAGNATSVILRDGRIAGVWDAGRGPDPVVRFHLFGRRSRTLASAVAERAADAGRFVHGSGVPVVGCATMVPLSERRAGAVLAPLEGAQPARRSPP